MRATGSSSAASTPTVSSSSGSSSDSDTKSVPESDGDDDDDDDDGADPARRMASLVALVAMSTDQNPSAVAKHLKDDAETYRALEREAKGSAEGASRAAEGPERRIARNLEVLVDELGCAPADLAAIVRAFPGVLALDADDDMRAVVQFLTGPIPLGGVGMTTAAAKECVRRDPKMLGQSVKDTRPALKKASPPTVMQASAALCPLTTSWATAVAACNTSYRRSAGPQRLFGLCSGAATDWRR